VSISSIVFWLIASSSNTILYYNCYGYSLVLLNPISAVHVHAFILNDGHTTPVPHRHHGHHHHNYHQHLDIRWTDRDHNSRPSIIPRGNKSRCYATGKSSDSSSRGGAGGTNPNNVITLSDDPRVYLISNILTSEECQSYIERAEQNNNDDSNTDDTQMQQSNAPQATINTSRLWPLPFLCLGAGIPPILRLLLPSTTSDPTTFSPLPAPSSLDLLSAALPPIAIAAAVTAVLSLVVTQGLQFYATSGASRTSESLALN